MQLRVVSSSKGQMKIQQMAFVLVAIFLFFGMVAVFYLTIKIEDIRKEAALIEEDAAKEAVLKLARSAEFAWKSGDGGREECSNCVDFDKLLVLKEVKGYNNLWNLDYLSVWIGYPEKEERECTRANYPNCNRITLAGVDRVDIGTPDDAFVPVCRWVEGHRKCEFGKIYASGGLE